MVIPILGSGQLPPAPKGMADALYEIGCPRCGAERVEYRLQWHPIQGLLLLYCTHCEIRVAGIPVAERSVEWMSLLELPRP